MRSRDVEPRVEKLLQEAQKYRDSDKELLLAIWADEGLVLNPYQTSKFMGATPAESITRARRELKKQYPASEVVAQARYSNFVTEQQDHSGNAQYRFL